MTSSDVYMFCKKCLTLIESVKTLKIHILNCKGSETQQYNNINDIYRSYTKHDCHDLVLNPEDYKQKIQTMLKDRTSKLSEKTVLEYMNILQNDYANIQQFLKNQNQIQYKKTINTAFNTIEIKLLEIGQFYNIPTRIEDIKWWSNSLNRQYQKNQLTPFIKTNFLENLMNISLCFFPIQEIIRQQLINKNGFNNIIFVRLNEVNYSFYYLDKIVDGKKYWKMDCRMEELINDIVDNLLFYCCKMFRKYYECVFGDNDYRKNFIEINNFTECELNQLLQNIMFLASMPKIYNYVQNMIIEHATHTPTSTDKFNLKSDDKIQLKKIENLLNQDWKSKVINIVRDLFDNDFDDTEFTI